MRTHWPSHGYYVVRGDDVRVIEMENQLPSKMHLVRLQNDGAVLKRAWLDGYYTSAALHPHGWDVDLFSQWFVARGTGPFPRRQA